MLFLACLVWASQQVVGLEDAAVTQSLMNPPEALSFSSDGKMIAAACRGSRTIRTWSVDGGKELKVVSVPDSSPWSLAFNGDGTRIVSSGASELVQWNLETGTEIGRVEKLPLPSDPNAIPGFNNLLSHPDGKTLLTSYSINQQLVRLDLSTLQVVQWFPLDGIFPESLSGDGQVVACTTVDQDIWLFDLKKQKITRTLKHPGLFQVRLSPDGKVAASSGNIGEKKDGTIRIWDVDKSRMLRQWRTDGPVTAMAISPQGRIVAGVARGSGDRTLTLWSVDTGKALWPALKAAGGGSLIQFNRDGTLLAYADPQNAIHLVKIPPPNLAGPK